MIKVNLLPPEYRVKERTPLPMMLGILGGVVLTSLSIVAFLYLRFGMYPDVVTQLRNKEQTKIFFMQKAKRHDELVVEKTNLEKLDKAVEQLKDARYPWTKAIDDLAWMVERGNKDKSIVKGWYEKLDFGPPRQGGRRPPGAGKEGGKVTFDLVVAGTDYKHIPVFREIMRKREYWLGRNILNMPLTKITPKDFKDFIPDVGLSTSLDIELNPTVIEELPVEEPGKAPGAAPPAGPSKAPAKAPPGGDPGPDGSDPKDE